MCTRAQEIRIQVLRAVRKEHHERHQQHEIEKALPLRGHDAEHGARRWRAMLFPRFRFRHARADVKRQQRRQAAQPEHRPPAPRRQDKTRHHRRKQVSDRIAALQNSGKDSPPPRRHRFHRQRSANAPLAAHADAIERAHHQEKRKIRRESARQLHHGKENHVGHQRNAPAVAVGQQAEDERAHRAHRQRHEQRRDDRFFSHVKLCGELVDQEDNHEEVKRVERPSQKGCGHRMGLARTRKPGTPLSRSLLNNGASYWFGRHALRNIAIEQRRANSGQRQQRESRGRLPEAQFPDAEQRRIHHRAAQHPRQQILAEVARFRQLRSERGDAPPSRGVRPHFPVKAQQNFVRLGWRQQRDQRPTRPSSPPWSPAWSSQRRRARCRRKLASGAAPASSPAPSPSPKFRSRH